MKNNKGAITLYVLMAMMFFIMALMGTFMIASNRLKNEKEINKQIQRTYESGDEGAIYNSYMGGDIIPIYNASQFFKTNSNEYVPINDEGGKRYFFSNENDTKYVLRNDIIIDAAEYGTDDILIDVNDKIEELDTRFELSGYSITILLLDGTAKIYEGNIRPNPNVPNIPDGFTLSKKPGETKVSEGLVIIGPDGSEFVWVPVENPVLEVPEGKTETEIRNLVEEEIINNNRYPMATKIAGESNYRGVAYDFILDTSTTPNGVTIRAREYSSTGLREPAYLTDSDSGDASSYNTVGITEQLLQTEYNEMIESVVANGGFYIGRYETSLNGSIKAQSKKDQIPMNNINWWNMYLKQKEYGNDITGVTSSMIWGSSWDQVMIWMRNVENEYASNKPYIMDSTGMGNRNGLTGLDIWGSTSEPAPTGCVAVKNIYDMAGNVWDWTIEAVSTVFRVGRRR